MNNAELSNYIASQLQRGLTSDDIATQLRTAHWPEPDIAAGFAAAFAQMAPAEAPVATPEAVAATITATPLVAASEPAAQTTQQQLPPPIKRGRMKTGWLLFKQSLRVIKDNPGLSRYMIISMVFSLVIFAILIAVFLIDINGSQYLAYLALDANNELTPAPTLAGLVVLIITGFIGTFITYYYAAALSSHVLGIFRGTPGTYAQHIGVARGRLPAIAVYALIATTVGLILRTLEERFKFVGWIAARLFGALWNLATSFVLPIIADTNESGVSSIKQSVRLFKATWGETITSRVSLGGLIFLIYFLVAIPASVVVALAFGFLFGAVGYIIAASLFFIGIIVLSVLEVLASNILNVSLYYYAQYKVVPPSFSPELLASVFASKKAKKQR